jgi:hypothetical protein
MARTVRVAATLCVSCALLVPMAGCSRDPYQTTVRKVPPVESTSTITPIERGKIRREALASVRQGVAAWLADDGEAMKRYFSQEQVEYYAKLREESKRENRYRIRKHSDGKMDVIDMSPDGTEVSVTYAFVNDSYWADSKGRVLEKPTHKESQIQIGAKRIDGRWLIVRMIGVPETIR